MFSHYILFVSCLSAPAPKNPATERCPRRPAMPPSTRSHAIYPQRCRVSPLRALYSFSHKPSSTARERRSGRQAPFSEISTRTVTNSCTLPCSSLAPPPSPYPEGNGTTRTACNAISWVHPPHSDLLSTSRCSKHHSLCMDNFLLVTESQRGSIDETQEVFLSKSLENKGNPTRYPLTQKAYASERKKNRTRGEDDAEPFRVAM